MGLDIYGTKFLIFAKTQGVCFIKTAMIGRQGLHLYADALRKNLADFGYPLRKDEADNIIDKKDGFAEPFLEALGAVEICSFDASDYEGASNISDFNIPMDERFKNHFNAVIDGGTLEHVFNFPVAIKSCMEMVKVGGHFLSITPANNFLGHGFYQFSPELFFRIFSAPNGFKLVRMIIFEYQPEVEWFEVTDPDAIKERVTLVNARPTLLLVIAEKVESVEIFSTPPQQSDYVSLWRSDTQPAESETPKPTPYQPRKENIFPGVVHSLYSFAPAPVKSLYRRFQHLRQHDPFNNPKFFSRIRLPKPGGLGS